MTAGALHTIGFRRWRSFLARFFSTNSPPLAVTPELIDAARRIARMVTAASEEGIVHGKCLEQSVVLWWLLKQRQLPAELQIGGRRTNRKFEAHAWVELAGTVVSSGDTVHQDFARFSRNGASLGTDLR
jgi:hypothetical protein